MNLWRSLPVGHPYAPVGDVGGGDKGMILSSGRLDPGGASGWRSVPLEIPVPLLAGERYVASVHRRSHHPVDSGYVTSSVADPPLEAVRGRIRYGKTAYPETHSDSNYWVDVEFTPTDGATASLWRESTTPFVRHQPDPSTVEVGLRFASEAQGYIDGIRFWKHADNAGPRTVSLWAAGSSPQLLETQAVSNTTTCGWETQFFASPIPISANTAYVASYRTSTGYAVDNTSDRHQFPVWNPPLRAESDSNGVYTYGPPGTFPNLTSNGSNYWVDVLFRTNAEPVHAGLTPTGSAQLP